MVVISVVPKEDMDLSSFGGIKREDGATEILFSCNYACPDCGFSFPELTPRMFSFNNPFGALRNRLFNENR